MTDLIDEAHAQAGLALLTANPNLLHVYDSIVPNPTPDPPWLLVYTIVAWPRDGIGTALTSTQVTVTTTFYLHCVGLTAAAARVVGMQARTSLLNARPVIAGRNCSPIKQVDSVAPERDESTGRAVFDLIQVYDFTSTG